MKRLVPSLLAAALAVPVVALPSRPARAAAWTGLRAGVAVVDNTWHVGASAGQYADTNGVEHEWDPNLQHTKNDASYGVASRLTVRALVLQGGDGPRIAMVKTDNYLAQDYLQRRVGQLLAQGSSGVTYENLMVSATHDHSSPYYSTPSWGVWVFQDVFDLRMFEYQARQMAAAIEQAAKALRPVRMGATTVPFSRMQGNIVRPQVGDDGSPAGYPIEDNDHGLVVMRFDDMTDPAHPKPYASWMNFGEHPEEFEGYGLPTADFVGVVERFVGRETGSTLVFTQGSVGSAEGPYTHWYPKGQIPRHPDGTLKAYGHAGYAQMERGARLMADAVIDGYRRIGAGRAQVNWVTNPPVKMLTFFTPGPVSHPYPGVSNCRTERTLDGEPGVPVLGLPDCYRDLPAGGGTSPLYDNLVGLGVPLPANYDVTAFSGVEENLRIKLQAVRVGEVLLASCSCEAQSDLILNLESRANKTQGDIFDGYDFAPTCHHLADGSYECLDTRDFTGKARLKITKAAYDRMVAEVHNDAKGWDDPAYAAQANNEPADPKLIKGNFTKEELPASRGYTLPVGLGHTGDYNGYTVSYREYQNRDSYRKALTSYGPHTADFMVTRLVRMAAYLKGGPMPAPEPTDPLGVADEQRQVAASEALGILSNWAYEGWAETIPDDVGPVAALVEPKPVQRFDAATFTWRGGGNYVDNPTARVERLAGGTWTAYADMSGEVQTFLERPAPLTTIAESHLGTTEWKWTANFEAFDAYQRTTQQDGQVANGTYRFVVDGSSHTGGAVKPYHLVSRSFTVSPWDGIPVGDPRLEAGKAVSFPVLPYVYPKTYKPVPVNQMVRDDTDKENGICRRCTFRPWAPGSTPQRAEITVTDDGRVVRVVPAVLRDGRWWGDVHLKPGELAFVRIAGVHDGFGEINGKPTKAVNYDGGLVSTPPGFGGDDSGNGDGLASTGGLPPWWLPLVVPGLLAVARRLRREKRS